MDDTPLFWSALVESSDDGALADSQPLATGAKAVSRSACHRTPNSLLEHRALSAFLQ